MATLIETLRVGLAAKSHARRNIKKGSTQIEDNDLSEEYFEFLKKGVGEDDSSSGIRQVQAEKLAEDTAVKAYRFGRLETDPLLIDYENCIEVTNKYSLGNCDELAYQALDYFLNDVESDDESLKEIKQKIAAEIYKIEGGDHVFLVLNRDPSSDPNDPSTWGKDAAICDPWANKVFSVRYYRTALKNFYREDNKNKTEYFNPDEHLLVPINNINTTFLRAHRTPDHLKIQFTKEMNYLLGLLNTYKSKLQKQKENLKKKYGEKDQKVEILSKKIVDTEATIALTNQYINYCQKGLSGDYRQAKSDLQQLLKNSFNKTFSIIKFTQTEQDKLFNHRGNSLTQGALHLFGVKTKTQKKLEKLEIKLNQELVKRK